MFDRLFKNKQVILGVLGSVCLILLIIYFSRPPENAARPDQIFNVQSFGTFPALREAMDEKASITRLVQNLLTHETTYLFTNYRDVNNDVASIMFLWADISNKKLTDIGSQRAIEIFIRRTYALPDDEPIVGNPLLEENPWGDLFGRFKAQILMQGQGHKIYDGLAYFDNERNQMVVRADLSKSFMRGFGDFLKNQPADLRRRYLNNLLLFIRETKGLSNLSDRDKEYITQLRNL